MLKRKVRGKKRVEQLLSDTAIGNDGGEEMELKRRDDHSRKEMFPSSIATDTNLLQE